MALELKKIELDRNVVISSLIPIMISFAGLALVGFAYITSGFFQIPSDERLELTKLIVTAMLGTPAIVAVIDRIK